MNLKNEGADNSNSKTFFFFFAINILLAVFVWFLIPETRKIALEEIDVLFGGSNHVEKGGDLLHVEDAHHANIGIDNVNLGDINVVTEAPQSVEIKA